MNSESKDSNNEITLRNLLDSEIGKLDASIRLVNLARHNLRTLKGQSFDKIRQPV